MFAILFLAGKGPVKCLSWHSQNRRDTHQRWGGQGGQGQTQLTSATGAFKLRKLIVANVSLQNCQLIQRSTRDPERGEAVPKAGNSCLGLNLEISSMSPYPNENHQSLVYFLKESLSHPGTKSHRTEASRFIFNAYNLRAGKGCFHFLGLD